MAADSLVMAMLDISRLFRLAACGTLLLLGLMCKLLGCTVAGRFRLILTFGLLQLLAFVGRDMLAAMLAFALGTPCRHLTLD